MTHSFLFQFVIGKSYLTNLFCLAVIGIILYSIFKKKTIPILLSALLIAQVLYIEIRNFLLLMEFRSMNSINGSFFGSPLTIGIKLLSLIAIAVIVISNLKRINKLLLAGSILFCLVQFYHFLVKIIHSIHMIANGVYFFSTVFYILPSTLFLAEAGLLIAFAVHQKRFSPTNS